MKPLTHLLTNRPVAEPTKRQAGSVEVLTAPTQPINDTPPAIYEAEVFNFFL